MRELIASIIHDIWSHWMQYLFDVSVRHSDGSITISAHQVRRWKVQMNLPYSELFETEKNSDREQADKILKGIKQ